MKDRRLLPALASAMVLSMLRKLFRLYMMNREPADPRLWHRWNTILPRRLAAGGLSYAGQQWRRLREDGRWEYREDPISDAEIADRYP